MAAANTDFSPRQLSYRQYISREREVDRAPYLPEQEFYTVIASGDTKKTKSLCQEPFTGKKGLGTLSDANLQNFKYHFTITIALIARACIDRGMPVGEAYDLSDFYILRCSRAWKTEELDRLHTEACLAYAARMNTILKRPVHSRIIMETLDYIYDHLHTRITITDLAAHVGRSPEHLSRLFHREIGQTITDYIRDMKLETAANMLQYSDWSVADISAILAFSSQSYFTQLFHQKYEVSPGEYRRLH